MTKTERYATIAVALIGMIYGLFGVFVSWDSAKFKQSMDQHASNAARYIPMILQDAKSAIKRVPRY